MELLDTSVQASLISHKLLTSCYLTLAPGTGGNFTMAAGHYLPDIRTSSCTLRYHKSTLYLTSSLCAIILTSHQYFSPSQQAKRRGIHFLQDSPKSWRLVSAALVVARVCWNFACEENLDWLCVNHIEDEHVILSQARFHPKHWLNCLKIMRSLCFSREICMLQDSTDQYPFYSSPWPRKCFWCFDSNSSDRLVSR